MVIVEYNISKSAQQPIVIVGWICTPNFSNDKVKEPENKESLG